MDTLLQEMLGGVRRLQENVRVTLFLKDRDKKKNLSKTNINFILRRLFTSGGVTGVGEACVSVSASARDMVSL